MEIILFLAVAAIVVLLLMVLNLQKQVNSHVQYIAYQLKLNTCIQNCFLELYNDVRILKAKE